VPPRWITTSPQVLQNIVAMCLPFAVMVRLFTTCRMTGEADTAISRT
jgi:hypothetical protein